MRNLFKNRWLTFLLVGTVAAVALAAAYTKFTYLEVKNDLLVDSTSTFTGTETHNGTANFNGTTNIAVPVLSGPVTPYSRTLTQLNALAASTTGQMAFCSNCTMSPICISSGIAAGSWTVIQSTAVGSTPVHCQ